VSEFDKDSFIQTCLLHIPFDGWTEQALASACAESGLASDAWQHEFPGGVEDVFICYADWADRNMVDAFDRWYEQQTADEISGSVPVHLQIKQLIMLRLQQAQPYREAVRKSLAYLSRPQTASLAPQLLYRTVDAMWRAAGDHSTDYNFYTKRASLSAVYSSTLLAFLSDDSEELEKTEAFLDRRLKDISRIPKMSAPFRNAASGVFSGLRRTAEMMMARRQR